LLPKATTSGIAKRRALVLAKNVTVSNSFLIPTFPQSLNPIFAKLLKPLASSNK
jgi:hypothetical protein